MKRTILLLLVAFFCLQAQAQDLLEVIKGNWLLKTYVEALATAQSPYEIENKLGDIHEFVFDANGPDRVLVSYYNYEGEEFSYLISGEKSVTIMMPYKDKAEAFTLEYAVVDGQETLFCTNLSGFDETYVKIPKQTDSHSAMETLINAKLFAKDYAAAYFGPAYQRSRNLAPLEVEFDVNGSVKGIEGYTHYRILANFDDIADFDVIEFSNPQTSRSEWFGWEIKGSLLQLYKLKKGTGEYEYRRGEKYITLKFNS